MGPADEPAGILTGDSQDTPGRTALHQHQLLAGGTGPERPCSGPAYHPVWMSPVSTCHDRWALSGQPMG